MRACPFELEVVRCPLMGLISSGVGSWAELIVLAPLAISAVLERWFREGLKMLKKCLIALLLVSFAAPVMADDEWAYTWGATTTVEWGWATKAGCEIDVVMKVVRWADLYCCTEADETLELLQYADHAFKGCVCVKLCVNFEGIAVTASFSELQGVDLTDDYAISIDLPGAPSYSGYSNNPSDTYTTSTIYLSGANLVLEICLDAINVDPQALVYSANTYTPVGVITTTLVPTATPGGIPAGGSSSGGGGGAPPAP